MQLFRGFARSLTKYEKWLFQNVGIAHQKERTNGYNLLISLATIGNRVCDTFSSFPLKSSLPYAEFVYRLDVVLLQEQPPSAVLGIFVFIELFDDQAGRLGSEQCEFSSELL